MRQNLALGGMLLLFAGLALAYNLATPIWEAPDEPLHYEYIRRLAVERALPAPSARPAEERPGGESEMHQMPLYYVAAALLTFGLDKPEATDWRRNPYATWAGHPSEHQMALHGEDEAFPFQGVAQAVHGLRLVSTLFGLGTVLCAYLAARAILTDRRLALVAAGLTGLVPGFVFSSAAINNDNAVIFFSSLALVRALALVRQPAIGWGQWWGYGLIMAAAALSKANGLFLIPFTGLLGLVLARADHRPSRLLQGALLSLGLVLLLAGPIYYRNLLSLPGSVEAALGGPESENAPPFQVEDNLVLFLVRRLLVSFWASFGWQSLFLDPLFYWAFGLLALAALVGLGRFWRSEQGWRRWEAGQRRQLVLVAGFIASIVLAMGGRFLAAPAVGLDQARLIYPGLAGMGILLVLGLSWLAPGRPLVLPLLATTGLIGLNLFIPFGVIAPAYPAPLPVWSRGQEPVLPHYSRVGFENGAELWGHSAIPPRLSPGERLDLSLYWQASRTLDREYVAFVKLLSQDWRQLAGDDRLPLEGVYPMSWWRPGEVVRDARTLVIPEDAPPGAYLVVVGMYAYPDQAVAIIGKADDRFQVTLGQVVVSSQEIVEPQHPPPGQSGWPCRAPGLRPRGTAPARGRHGDDPLLASLKAPGRRLHRLCPALSARKSPLGPGRRRAPAGQLPHLIVVGGGGGTG